MAVYVSDLLTVTPAPVDASPASTRTWQWLRGSTNISGATSTTYTVVTADLGSPIFATQLETNFLGTTRATSAATETVEAYNPAALFRSSEPGVWFDPNDITTLYKGPTGVAPVTAPGDTVWTMLDKSRGGPGPELVVNGNFSSGATGWTTQAGWSISAGALNAVAAANGSSAFQTLSGLKPSTPYRITFEVSNYSAGFVYAQFFSGVAGDWLSGNGQKSIILTTPASVANTNFGITSVFSTFTGTIDNISVKELPGNHATQPTLASQPTYGIVPAGGRRNLLTFSEVFNNAVWNNASVTTAANVTTAPDGTSTADRLLALAGNTFHYTRQTVAAVSGACTYSIYVKKDTSSWIFFGVADDQLNYFNFDTGLFGATDNVCTKTDVGNGWWRLTATRTMSNQAPGGPVGLASGNGGGLFNANGTEAVFLWGAQIELSSTATPYQRVGTTYDVTEDGVPSLGYLFFDGASDSMSTPTITPGTDKSQVFLGVRKLSDVSVGIIFETSTSSDSNSGTIAAYAPSVAGNAGIGYFSKGTIFGVANVTSGYASPSTVVQTGLGDISGDRATLRLNGTQAAQATTDQGTGNYLAHPLYLGARGGSSSFFQGQLFPLIVRFGTTLTAARITATENWVSTQTPLQWTVGSGFWNDAYPWSDISAWRD